MAQNIEDIVIETGVDSLLDYLAENGNASCKEISNEIGVERTRIKEWAEALSDQDLIEKHHTLSSGLVLEYSKKNFEEAGRKKAEIEEELDAKSKDLREELKQKEGRLDSERAKLIEQEKELDEEKKEELVGNLIDELEKLEDRINRNLENNNLDSDTVELISEIEDILYQVEILIENQLTQEQNEKLNEKTQEAVSEVEDVLEYAEGNDELEEEKQEIRKKVTAVKKLEENIETAKQNSDLIKGGKKGFVNKIKSKIPVKKKNSGYSEESNDIDESNKIKKEEIPEDTYRELVDENRVTEVMRKISLIKNPDYEAILNAEKQGRNRPELTSYLEERVNEN